MDHGHSERKKKDVSDQQLIIGGPGPVALPPVVLPRYVIIKSNYNTNYLRYYDEDVQAPKFLQFSGPNSEMNPNIKFEVEVAKTDANYVHIRSCYNNKYWAIQGQSDNWIAARVDKPDEDQSSWSCTLFQPILVDPTVKNVLRLRHVKTGHYACLWMGAPPLDNCLKAGTSSTDTDQRDVYTVIDWESIVILPKRIVFKGENNQYLKANVYNDRPFMAFNNNVPTEQSVPNEIIPGPDGTIRIKNEYLGKFWRHSNETWQWILADYPTDSTSDELETLFQPVKIGNNIIALRNLGNNMFCKRLTADGQTSCLSAFNPNIDIYGRLIVEELVFTRTIGDVNFRFGDARIYGERTLLVANEEAVNRSQVANTIKLTVEHTDNRIRSWRNSASLRLGIKTTMSAGIPTVDEGGISMSLDFSASTEWGETMESQVMMEPMYTISVPPMTKVKVSFLATQAYYDVPFSYTQRDVLPDGSEVVTQANDGVYTGLNSFNYHYETVEEPVSLIG